MLRKSPRLALSSLLLCLPIACQHIELRNHTVRQATTLTDIQYKQVLGNLAMFSDNPNSLPYLSVTGTGLTNITDSLNAGSSFNWDKLSNVGRITSGFVFDKGGATFGGTSTSSEQWTSGSILNPDQLLYMRCIYQSTVGAASCGCDCEKKVRAYFQREPCYLEAMHPGWFCVGKMRDVPKEAAYVGRHKDTFVWVMPEGVDSLTKLTLAILDVATAIKIGEVGRVDPFATSLKAFLSSTQKRL
jgi:hypothetical protein